MTVDFKSVPESLNHRRSVVAHFEKWRRCLPRASFERSAFRARLGISRCGQAGWPTPDPSVGWSTPTFGMRPSMC